MGWLGLEVLSLCVQFVGRVMTGRVRVIKHFNCSFCSSNVVSNIHTASVNLHPDRTLSLQAPGHAQEYKCVLIHYPTRTVSPVIAPDN